MSRRKKLLVLDLFSGLRGWSDPFLRAGHTVVTLDIDPVFEADMQRDIMKVQKIDILDAFGGRFPDVILASPPCESFSTGGWHQRIFEFNPDETDPNRRYKAVAKKSKDAKAWVRKTVRLIEELDPALAIIENPKAMLRKLGLIPYPINTVWYCHYGDRRAKPTDLWIRGETSLKLKPPCHRRWYDKDGNDLHGPSCCCNDHPESRRGSVTGTQGMSTAEAGKIPRALARSVMKAAERDILGV